MKRRCVALAFILCLGLLYEAVLATCASAKSRPELQLPGVERLQRQSRRVSSPRVCRNTLLVMPSLDDEITDAEEDRGITAKDKRNVSSSSSAREKTDVDERSAAAGSSRSDDSPAEAEEELSTTIRSMGGSVVDTIGTGRMTTWVVRFPSTERFLQAERKLVNDSRVKSLQRDYLYRNNLAGSSPVNDPYFASEWYMDALNVLPAWDISKGGTNLIGIVDSGTDISISDLAGKSYAGFDAVDNKQTQTDVEGHGTMVATTAAATADNGVGTAGPATLAQIYPVRVGFANGDVSVSAILKAIQQCGDTSVKIINLSSNGDPPFSFAHKKFNRVFHRYCQWYHDEKGGLIFNSAGNSGTQDSSRLQPYLIVVSAIDESYNLAYFSTWGRCVWFTAPGTNIYCTEKGGKVVSVSGTSFSSPLCASIAALIWGAKPSLTNLEVESILKASCQKPKNREWTRYFGWGMPDAEKAMKLTLGK
ncbi:S8 family serine peptidase [Candidatus Obscuribacterales bacterium]|nr:S8 family serine peptidase [Candidatus Obscuribacterales bacterium]